MKGIFSTTQVDWKEALDVYHSFEDCSYTTQIVVAFEIFQTLLENENIVEKPELIAKIKGILVELNQIYVEKVKKYYEEEVK